MKKVFAEEDLVKNLSLYYLNAHLKKKPIAKYHEQIDSSQLHEREKYRKKSEILLMNAFLHHFPGISFESLTCESPDFIAKFNDKKIGIELTEVINHLEIKKTESVLNKIFRRTEIILESEDIARFRGVYFLDFKNISKLDLMEKSDEIIQNIIKCIKERKPSKCIKSIRKTPHRRNVFITHDYRPELFDPLSSAKIISLIHKKNEKFPYYDRSVDECWLVIVSDMNSPASRYTFIEDRENLNRVQSPFDKIMHLENLCGGITGGEVEICSFKQIFAMIDLFQKHFAYYKGVGDKTFAQLSDEQLFWQPNPESNSVAIIVQHLAGNMLSRWTNFLTEDGEKPWRNRDSEFVENLKSRAEMLDYWEKGWAVFFDALNQITDENQHTEITIRGEKHSVLDAVLRQLAHYPYHIGQMVYIAKILKNDDWQTLSVPRNKSEEHNQMMREKFANGQNNPLDSAV